MSKSKQMSLPGFDRCVTGQSGTAKSGATTWYYVAIVRRDVMLGLDDNGNYVFIPHDTVRLTPHLFNNKSMAERIARKYKFTTVKKWPWNLR